jgi:hypothetical protein
MYIIIEEKQIMEYEKLPATKKKNGYVYKQVSRSDKAAIYEQIVEKDINGIPGTIIGYEVFRIIVGKPYVLIQKHGTKKGQKYSYPSSEKFCGNEDFGKIAWSYDTLQSAMNKFNELNEV